MSRIDYSAARIQLLRGLAASIGDGTSRGTILRLASEYEQRARYRQEATETIRNRIADQ